MSYTSTMSQEKAAWHGYFWWVWAWRHRLVYLESAAGAPITPSTVPNNSLKIGGTERLKKTKKTKKKNKTENKAFSSHGYHNAITEIKLILKTDFNLIVLVWDTNPGRYVDEWWIHA